MGFDAGELLRSYGYVAVLIGTFCEGETFVLAGAWAAHEGYLRLPWVIACAMVGSSAGDQLYFVLGRVAGGPWLARRPKLARRADQILGLLARHEAAFIIGFRFLYGFRTVVPIVLGAAGLSARTFLPLNLLGAAIWAVSVASGGSLLLALGARGVPLGREAQAAVLALGVPTLLGLLTLTPRPWFGRVGRRLSRRTPGPAAGGGPRQRPSG